MVHPPIPKLGNIYKLDEERYGVLKFMGETKFANGTWYGFELLGSVGKHDGEVNGKRYFKTSNNPPRGIFVRRAKIRAQSDLRSIKQQQMQMKEEASEIQQNAQDDWKPAKYMESTDGHKQEGRDLSNTQFFLTSKGRKKKLGPREIGRIEGWKPAVYHTSDTGKFLAKRRQSFADGKQDITVEKKQQTDAQHYITETGLKKKLGPREIGRISSNWKPAKFDTPDTGEFLARRRTSVTEYNVEKRQNKDTQHYVTDTGKKKKLGPRQIGRNTQWKPAQYDVPKCGEFLEKRRYLVAGNTKSKIDQRTQSDTQHYITENGKKKKLGPREIGKVKNWKPAKYEVSDTGPFLKNRESSFVGRKRLKHDIRRKSDSQHYRTETGKLKKLGPRQIGHITNWSEAKYDIPETGNFLDKRRYLVPGQVSDEVERREQKDAQHMVNDKGRLKKLGPRDIGRIKGWKAAEYDICEAGDFLRERGSSFARAYVKEGGRLRKSGPRDIKKPVGWVPAKYDVPVQEVSDAVDDPQDKQGESDSGFLECKEESVNVSTRTSNSTEDSTDELRF